MPSAALAATGRRRRPAARGDRRRSSTGSCVHAGGATTRERDRPVNILLVDDRRGEPARARGDPRAARPDARPRAAPARRRCAQLLHEDFAVILLDVQMPGIDGFETAELIKQRERTRHIPIIFLTAISKDERARLPRLLGRRRRLPLQAVRPATCCARRSRSSSSSGRRRTSCRRQDELLQEQELADGRARERGALPVARRRDAADRLDGRRRTASSTTTTSAGSSTPGMTRRAGRRAGWTRSSTPTTCRGRCEALAETLDDRRRRSRSSTGFARSRRHVPLASRPRGADARRGRRDRRLGRHGDRHRRPEARRGARSGSSLEAGAVLGSSLDYAQTLADVARLAVPRDRRLVRGRHRRRRTAAQRSRSRTSTRARSSFARELRAPLPAGPSRRGRRRVLRTGEPRARRRDHRRDAARGVAVDELHLELVRELGLAARTCACRSSPASEALGVDHARHGGVRPRATARRPRARRGARAPRGRRRSTTRGSTREAERARAGGARARGRRRRRLPRRPRRASSGSGTRRPRRSPALAPTRCVGRPIEDVVPGWDELAPRIPVASEPGRAGARRDASRSSSTAASSGSRSRASASTRAPSTRSAT